MTLAAITASREQRQANLRRLLNPRHVAFVGGRSVAEAIRQCLDDGFAGAIWPVNPSLPEIAGLPCLPDIESLPEAPDATFIAVRREATIDVVRALARRGAGGCVCYAAGYAEVGAEGAELQRRLVAEAGTLALVGPNCYGLLNYVDGVVLWPSAHGGRRVERGVALVAQSGNIALTLTLNHRSVPFSHVVSVGNQAVLGIPDYVLALAEDPRVAAIALYIEGLTDIAGFAAAAARATALGKPIVVLKGGRSPLGARLAMSHTSSLAGDDALYDALFQRLGVIRAESLSGLLETAKLLAVLGRPTGGRLAVFTCSGGECLLTADRAAALGLALPGFTPDQEAALRAQLPAFATVANPLDYNTSLWGDRALLTQCFGTVLSGPFDAGMLMLDYPHEDAAGIDEYEAAVDALIAAAAVTGKPCMVASTLPELLPERTRQKLLVAGLAPLQGLDEALDAFALAARPLAADAGLPPPLPGRPAGQQRHLLDEWGSKHVLAEHGLGLPEGRLVTPDEAGAAAAALGFPVVAKVARPAIAHKTEASAVALGLGDAAAVEAAVARMAAALAAGGRPLEAVLVERQVAGAVAELIVGVKRDPPFGPALVIGAGGVLVEMVKDSTALLLPTSLAAIEAALGRLRVARLLRGYRGRPAGDVAAAVRAIAAVAETAIALGDRLVELDVNPLLVLPDGQGAVAVDALIVTTEPLGQSRRPQTA
jgi:acyl-CoA synthetase (NDP forming)